jgi:sec-independent protein translocase protein TatC
VASEEDELRQATMGFLDHLEELRTRLIRACVAIAAGMAVAFFFVDRIGTFVLGPTLRVLPAGSTLVSTRPGEGFSFYLDIAFLGGIVLAAPLVTYQVWRFIAPALYAKEKRLAIPFVVLASAGTVAGAAFSHYVLFPSTMAFFGTFNSASIKFLPRLEDTFELYKKMTIGMVLVFQMPTLAFFLAKMRVLTARLLWRNFKYAILIIFIAAAMLTSSPDPWNQAIFAAPMIMLYVLSIGIAWLVGPRREPDEEERGSSPNLRLVVTAAVIDQMRKRRAKSYRRRNGVLVPDRW